MDIKYACQQYFTYRYTGFIRYNKTFIACGYRKHEHFSPTSIIFPSGSGRPRETTLPQDRHITLIHLRNRFVTAVDIARRTPGIRNNSISDQTVRNRLRQSGLRSRRPLKCMELKRRHRIARLQWARVRFRWRRNTWQNILFSDESKFNLKFSDGRVRIFIVVVGNVSLIWRRWCNGMGWN